MPPQASRSFANKGRTKRSRRSVVTRFKPVAKLGLETGVRDRASYVMQQGNIRLVLTSALHPDHEIARHCTLHGDGVKVIALEVSDCEAAVREAKARGATVLQPAQAFEDAHGALKTGILKYAGDTVFKLVERKSYRGPFAPGFVAIEAHGSEPTGLAAPRSASAAPSPDRARTSSSMSATACSSRPIRPT